MLKRIWDGRKYTTGTQQRSSGLPCESANYPALAKSAGAGHPPVLWRTHETWRRPGHPTYSLKDAIAELPRPCKRRKSRATSRVVADLQCVSNAGPPGLVIMPVTPTRERR